MNTKQESLAEIYHQWQAGDLRLEANIERVRDWMQEVNQLGIPHFGETAARLGPFRKQLVEHYQREDEMIAALAKLYLPTSPEVNAMRQQSRRDRQHLLGQLDDLIERLNQSEPPFESWQAALDEVDVFVEQLEQHEDSETEMMELLMPGDQQPGA